MTIEFLLEDFCHYARYMRGVSKETECRYREKISYFAKASKITLVSDVSDKTVQSFFLHGRRDKGWKISTY
ncbi:MAG: hypothetical protein ACKVIG_15675, partial [Flavobacteriales bacterium]